MQRVKRASAPVVVPLAMALLDGSGCATNQQLPNPFASTYPLNTSETQQVEQPSPEGEKKNRITLEDAEVSIPFNAPPPAIQQELERREREALEPKPKPSREGPESDWALQFGYLYTYNKLNRARNQFEITNYLGTDFETCEDFRASGLTGTPFVRLSRKRETKSGRRYDLWVEGDFIVAGIHNKKAIGDSGLVDMELNFTTLAAEGKLGGTFYFGKDREPVFEKTGLGRVGESIAQTQFGVEGFVGFSYLRADAVWKLNGPFQNVLRWGISNNYRDFIYGGALLSKTPLTKDKNLCLSFGGTNYSCNGDDMNSWDARIGLEVPVGRSRKSRDFGQVRKNPRIDVKPSMDRRYNRHR